MTTLALPRRYLYVLTLIVSVFCSSSYAQQKTIEIVTEIDWSESRGVTGKKGSIVTQISVSVLERMGYEVNITFSPWARALRMAMTGTVDGVSGIYFTEQRAETLIFTNPVTTSELVLYKRKDSDIIFTGDLSSLAPYKIGVVRNYTYGASFDDANYLNKVIATTSANNLNMLLANRIDLIIESDKTIEFLLRETYPQNIGDIMPIKPILKKQNVHFAFSKKLLDYEELTQRFNQTLYELREDGSIKILETQFLMSAFGEQEQL